MDAKLVEWTRKLTITDSKPFSIFIVSALIFYANNIAEGQGRLLIDVTIADAIISPTFLPSLFPRSSAVTGV